MTMKVILLTDVKKVGKKGEVVEVSDGYARNFLFARKLAVVASDTGVKVLNEQKKEEEKRHQELKKEALSLKEALEKEEFVFKVNSKNGKVFNSVSTKHLQEALKEKGYTIDKRKIIDNQPITSLGYSHIKVELYKDVIATIKVKLVEE